MLNEFKTRKLAEFDEKFPLWSWPKINKETERLESHQINGDVKIKQFISDLIDEMVEAIPKKENTRDDGVLMEIDFGKITTIGDVDKMCEENRNVGWNKCRETLINNLTNK